MKYLVYDLESTGLDVVSSEILEICVVDYKSERVLMHEYVYPELEKEISNSDIHGITIAKIKSNNGLTQIQMMNNLIQLLSGEDVVMIAHNNNGYDQLLLEYSLKRYGLKIPENVLFSDSLPIFRCLIKNILNHKLGTIYNYFYGDNDVQFHCAIDDTVALVKILKKCNQRELQKLVKYYERPAFTNDKIKQYNVKKLYCLERVKNDAIQKVFDIYDVYHILNNNFVMFLKQHLHIYSKFKIEKIIQQLDLMNPPIPCNIPPKSSL